MSSPAYTSPEGLRRALRESEARYRALIDALDAAFCVVEVTYELDGTGRDYRFLEVNAAFERHTGLRDAVGRWMRDLAPEHEQHWFDTYARIARTGEPERFAERAAALEDRWFEVRAYRTGDAADRRVAILFNDVSDRKRAEQALEASEARMSALNADLERQVMERARERSRTWQVSPDLLGVMNDEGLFESSNPAWQNVLGWSPEELSRISIFELIHPDDLDAAKEGFAALQRGELILRFENRYRTKDGGYRWLSWVSVPEEGKYYSSARDITREKEQAEALRIAEEQLRQAQKLEAIGQLTGGVAHDFNNLLTVIRGSADLLRRPGLPDERRLRYAEAISDTAMRATRLTGQLLAFARRQALKPEIFDVGAAISALGDMIGTLGGARIRTDLSLPDEACYIHADPSQFDTALINMAANARDAMAGEGVLTVSVSTVSAIPALRVHPAVPGDFVAVALSDTGGGIAPETLEQIFEPFFTTKQVGEGTGLGLSQVFGFAKQSGGEVQADSTPGEGATFTLYLPRAYPADVAPEAQAELVVDGAGARVLVVEDNPEVGAFATQMLGDLGYDAVPVTHAEEALAELGRDADAVDVVFTDVVMPGMTGLELAHEINRRWPGLPVVLTSGYSDVLVRDGSFGFELLHKPYSLDDLSRVLRRAAGRRERTPSDPSREETRR